MLRWIAKGAAGVVTIAITLLTVLLLTMLRERKTTVILPAPTGHFAVGRTTFAWTDEAAADELAPVPGSKRQVFVWVWYPALQSHSDAPTEYLPLEWRTALEARQGAFMRLFFKHDSSAVITHSFSDAPVSPEESAYPVVLLRAGGSALTTDFTTLAEDLASHGYFVVGFDAPYRSLVFVQSDGRVIARSGAYNIENANGNLSDPVIGRLLAMWVSDSKFVVDRLHSLNEHSSGRFSGRMDLDRIGMFGHSFGGATALEFCHEDPRCKAALDLDGIPFGSVVREGFNKPCVFLLSDHSREMTDSSSQQVLAEIQSLYDRLPDGRLYVVIRTANHFSFSDQILLNSHIATRVLRDGLGFGGLDGRRGLAISADYVHTFFDVYLRGAPPASLTRLSEKYQEAETQERRP